MNTESTYIVTLILSVVIVAALMNVYKSIYWLITKKSTNKVVNQLVAWLFSFIATVLCWWATGIPDQFKKVFIYMFVVYVLQMKVDLECIKKILDKKIQSKTEGN